MKTPKIRIFLTVENAADYQKIRQITEQIEESEIEIDWVADLRIGLGKLQQIEINNYDIYILDEQAFFTEQTPNLAAPEIIDRLRLRSAILLTSNHCRGLAAIKAGARDYWHKERLDQETIQRSLYLSVNWEIDKQKLEQKTKTDYQEIFDRSFDGIFLLQVQEDNSLVYETINSAYAAIIGLPSQEIIGKTLAEIMPKELLAIVWRKFESCMKTKQPINYEYTYPKGGKNYIYHTIVAPVVDRENRVIKLQGSSRDLTAEKEAIAIQIKQTRYRHLLRSLALKIHQSTENQEILETTVQEVLKALQVERVILWQLVDQTQTAIAEATLYNLFPFSPRSIDPQDSPWQIPHSDDHYVVEVCHRVQLENLTSTAQNILQQQQIRSYLNIPILQLIQPEAQQPPKNSIWGFLSLHQCRHYRHWHNAEIEILQELASQLSLVFYQKELLDTATRKQQELTRSNAELEQFAYVASHDLQAPLQTIANYSKLLKRRYQGQIDEKADKFLHYITEAAQRMQNQIEDLLEYSRVGKQQQNIDTIDCRAVLDQALANLHLSIDKNQAQIQLTTPLPAIVGDSNQLLVLFQNLIANAIKYRTESPPAIEISSECQGNYWLFKIKDNGIGIEPQYQQRIFQIFQRLHTQEQYPGTGIGLAICQKIVENHNGKIWVEGNPEGGSVFYFTLPSGAGSQCYPLICR
jgi:PAS domain S-box-containing protein